MYLQSVDSSSSAISPEKNANAGFIDGFCNAFEQPLDGIAQLRGEKRTDHFAVNPNATGMQYWSQEAGLLCGNAALYLGVFAAASHVPGVGRMAPVVTGAALGFLNPVNANEGTGTRIANAAIGAGTMSIMEFGPSLLGKTAAETFGAGLRNAAITNGTAGLLSVQADSFLHRGHAAGLGETTLGMATWAGMGMAFRSVGEPFRTKPAVEPEAEVNRVTVPTRMRAATPGEQTIHVTSDGAIRPYDLYVPSGYNPKKPIPVMLMLHGVSPNPMAEVNLAAESQMNLKADAEGFAVAYPYARDTKTIVGSKVYAWNTEGTGLTKPVAGYDDNHYLDKVIADVQGRLNIDRSRIYGVGFSEGGMIINNYHARNPGTFAGIASICGTMNGSEPLPLDVNGRVAPTNALIVLADNDHFLPINGGRGLMTALVPRARDSQPLLQADLWNAANGSGMGVNSSTPAYRQTDWLGADGVTRVRQLVVNGGNHAWHGSPHGGWPVIGRALPADTFDTTNFIWDFLKNMRLRAPSVPVEYNQFALAAVG